MSKYLTGKEKEFWHDNGYLVVRGVLSEKLVEELLKSVDNIIASKEKEEKKIRDTAGSHGKEYYNILHAVEYTDKLDQLLDYKPIFGKILSLLGPFIQVMGCDIFVRHPTRKTSDIEKFHTDGGAPLQQILPNKNDVPLQVKVQYFLTDIHQEDASNFMLIPGSHKKKSKTFSFHCLLPEYNQFIEQGKEIPDGVKLFVNKGDVLIHPWSLWHAVSPNRGNTTRRSISVRYGQMWLRPYYYGNTPEVMARLTSRQKRLLGYLGENVEPEYVYRPYDQLDIIYGEDYKDLRISFEEKNGV